MGTKFYKARQISFFRSGRIETGKYLVCLSLLILGSLSGYSQTSLSFSQIPYSNNDLMAPDRGAEHWGTTDWDNVYVPEIPSGNTKPMNYYTRFNWTDIESSTTQGQYNWSVFDAFVHQAINNRAMFSFGVMPMCTACGSYGAYPTYLHNLMQAEGGNNADWYYSSGGFWVPNWNSTNWLGRWAALMTAIANHINTTTYNGVPLKNALYYVDIRGYGDFGEWHTYPWTGTEPTGRKATVASLASIVDAVKTAFPNSPLVLAMGAFDTQNASQIPAQAAYYNLTTTNNWGQIGWRRDNLGDDGYNSWLTGNPGTYNGVAFSTLIMNKWKFAPIGGEPANDLNGTSRCGSIQCDLLNEVNLFHMSSFGNGNFPIMLNSTLSANVIAASKASGYRLVLTGGNMTTTLTSGGAFNITVNWQNIGVAPVYETWNVVYELRNSSGTVVWTGNSAFTPKLFLPQTTATPVSDNFTLSSVASGTYSMYMIVRDPLNYKAPLPLAITGRNADGSYLLRSNITVGTGGPVNQLPTANAGADKTIQLPTSTVSFTGSGTDPDGTISTYTWTKVSGPASGTITTPSAASTTVTGLVQGVYKYVLTVTDNQGGTSTDTVQATVNAAIANLAPNANAGTDLTITLPASSVTLNGSASSDPDGSISTYLWTKLSGPTQFTIGNTATASTIVNNLTAGSYSFQLKVTDNAGATALDTVKVTVNTAANQPPVANAGTDLTITLPTSSVTLNGSASSDPDGSISTYLWTKISGPAQYTIGNTSTASTLVSNLTAGSYSFQLKVTDNLGATALDTIKVTVNTAANQPPVANAGIDQGITLPTNSVTINGSGSNDLDGSIAGYLWTKIAGPAQFTIANSSAASTTVSNLTAGFYSFQLKVTDNLGATAMDTVNINVSPAPVNQPPVAKAGSDQTITLPVNSVSINGGSSSDPDGTIATYLWTKVSGPGQFNIGNANAASTLVSNLTSGVYSFQLKVTDNGGAIALDTIKIIVNAAPANQPPVANAGADISITLPTNTTNVNGSASSDADGTIASYAWSQVSGPSTASITNSVASTTGLTGLVQGLYVFSLKVTDNNGAFNLDSIKVTVNPAPNQPPVANAGTSKSITLPVNSVGLDGSLSNDPDGSISSFRWTQVGGPSTATITGATASVATSSNLIAGLYTFQLSVTDNNGATATATVKVTVVAATIQPPVANAGADQTITLPVNSVTIDGSASSASAGGSIVSYTWTEKSGPSTISLSNTAQNTVSNLVAGVYVFALTVTDNNAGSDTDSVTITVRRARNQRPWANAGSNKNITFSKKTTTGGTSTAAVDSTASTTLDGTASYDPDGSIVSYNWTQISGPSSSTLTDSNTPIVTVSGLILGQYVYQLTVVDNNGDSSSAQVKVIVSAPPNAIPMANAGLNQSITAPASTVILDGSASSDPDGTITAYSWVTISGPGSVTISNSNTATPSVQGLTTGVYIFQLTVTDNSGATAQDQVTIIVNPKPILPNQAPVANAGTSQTITEPANSISLNGANSFDPDGTIAAYNWTQISGPNTSVISGGNTTTPSVTQLIVGQYIYQLTVTDNNGVSNSDQVTITVNPGTQKVNIQPVAIAGNNDTISLPNNIYLLDASGSTDPDGTIDSYSWKQLSGPSTASSTSMNSSQVTLSNLEAGDYEFEVTVTDNAGATSTATMKLTVEPGSLVGDQFVVFPNPAHDVINGKVTSSITGTVKINVYDMSGKLVEVNEVEKASDVVYKTFDISGLAPGMYTIQINIANRKTMVTKFIKY